MPRSRRTSPLLVSLTLTGLLSARLPAQEPAPLPAQTPDIPPPSVMERIEQLGTIDEASPEAPSAGERFDRLVDLLREHLLETDPAMAEILGQPPSERWSDVSVSAWNRLRRDTERILAVLETIDRAELDASSHVNYDLLRRRFEITLRGAEFDQHLLPIDQLTGLQHFVPGALEGLPRRTVADYERILARLDGVPTLVDQTLVLLRRGLARGVTPPRVALRDVPQQFLDLLADKPLASPLLVAFAEMPDTIAPAERDRLTEAATRSYTARVRPALEKIHRYLILTYLPTARTSISMKDLPDGAAWYAYQVELFTSSGMEPRAIHELGLREVERLRGEMEKVIEEIGFSGGFEAFNDFLRAHAGFFYEDAGEMLKDYRDITKRIDARLPELFGRLPRMPYGVEPMPAHTAKSQTAAYYSPGSFETGRSGTFYVNTYDLKSRPKWRMESLSLHEAAPGHHLQVALAREHGELPWFRRIWSDAAFAEGWALYAESLGYEMGLYKDPYQRFGQLTSEMWRALRLVVDTGIHMDGWSRQRAIDYMFRHTGRSEHEVVVEVDRYVVWPGQALAYKLGELRIRDIRARAERELGESFDLRAFHDALLGDGSLPLAVVEAKMNDWIEAQR